MDTEYNLLSVHSNGYQYLEGNPGYTIQHWYIPQKYKNLKAELLCNRIHRFTSDQFDDILQESTAKLQSWIKDSNCRG